MANTDAKKIAIHQTHSIATDNPERTDKLEHCAHLTGHSLYATADLNAGSDLSPQQLHRFMDTLQILRSVPYIYLAPR
jgi:hypothetical protein